MSTLAVGDKPRSRGEGSDRSIVFIGAGNVATHLAPAMERAGIGCVVQVYSRAMRSAQALASRLYSATAVCEAEAVNGRADVYVVSLADHAVGGIVERLPHNNALWIHTSGSLPIGALSRLTDRVGVLYPLQTFSKNVYVDMSHVPLFVEGCTPEVAAMVREMAERLSTTVRYANGDLRRRMHIAAVFACNFTNHMFTVADDLLRKDGLSLEVLHPLLNETVRKALEGCPADGQTGPAVRGDMSIVEKHASMLPDDIAAMYRMISMSIYNRHHNEQN